MELDRILLPANLTTSHGNGGSVTGAIVGVLEMIVAAAAIASVRIFVAALRAAASLDSWVFFLLAAKPIIDLTWRWHFFQVGIQGVNLQAIIGIVVVILTAAAWLYGGRRFVHWPQVSGFLLIATFSALFTLSSVSANELLRLYAGLAFFFVAGLVLGEENVFDRFSQWFLLAVTVPVLLSYLQVAGLLPFEYWDWIGGDRLGRASGTYQHPVDMIRFFVYAVPITLYLWDKRHGDASTRRLLTVFLLLSMGSVPFTYDRSMAADRCRGSSVEAGPLLPASFPVLASTVRKRTTI
jgi:hypothetical protein